MQTSGLTARVAVLDHDQVYWGLGAPIPVEEVKAGDVVFCSSAAREALPAGFWVEQDCDLPGGKYRLAPADADHPGWHFVPLPAGSQKQEPGTPTFEQALYDLLTQGREAPRVQAWVKWFESTMDEKGARK